LWVFKGVYFNDVFLYLRIINLSKIKKMKVLNIVLLLVILLAVGCKTQKIAPKPQPMNSETVVSPSDNASSTIKSKEESITAAKGEASDLGSKRFYIILGSFGVYKMPKNSKSN